MRMTDAIYISAALVVGVGSAVQVGMIGSLGRQRGAFEATLISMLASIVGLAVFLVLRSLRDNPPELPSPLDPPDGCAFHQRCPFARERCVAEPPPLREIDGRQVACHFAGEV